MKFTKFVAIALISGSVSAGALVAQTRPGSEPSEFPPSSYKGKQYVDSNGCVFIRAGIDGNVSWVPRVTRKRTGVCGFRPTFAGQVSEPTPVQTAASTQITIRTPVVVAAPVAAIATVTPKAKPIVKPRPTSVAKVAVKPKVVRQVAKRPAPIVEKVVQPSQPVRTVAVAPIGQSAACAGASPISSQYLQHNKLKVRCGPQGGAIIGARISTAPTPRAAAPAVVQRRVAAVASQTVQVPSHRRIVPRHVAVRRVNTTNVTVPAGYKRVWTDGRLNPNRAEQNLAGHRAMNLIWTSTVPRRLINQANGHDVTASVPLVYPYVDYAAQQENLGQVTIVHRNGHILKRILRNATGLFTAKPRQARIATVARQPTYSTRSTPNAVPKVTAQRAEPKAEAAGRGFVQVGAFTDTDAAHRMANKVKRMGLPVRVGRYTRNGQTTRLVIAGPFDGKSSVNRAVNRLRGAGYNAFAR